MNIVGINFRLSENSGMKFVRKFQDVRHDAGGMFQPYRPYLSHVIGVYPEVCRNVFLGEYCKSCSNYYIKD